MKKIILFKGGIETLGYFSLQLAKAFTGMGHEVFVFNLLQEEESFIRLSSFIETGNTVMITFNFTGISGEEIFFNSRNEYIWKVLNIPCINIIVDHPFYYHKLINQVPDNYHQICIDRYHESYMKRFFPHIKTEPFMPSAGTKLNNQTELNPLEEREMDLVFTGNYTPPNHFDQYIDRIDQDYSNFYRAIIKDLITHPTLPMEEAFETHIRRELGNLSEDDLKKCMESMIFIDLYVRFYFRGLVIKTLVDSGLKVHVFGKGWDLLECRHPENIIDGDSIFSRSCLKKISQAKISLNVMPWFKDGAHDRIFNSMLNGALCLSDSSIYLEETLRDGQDIVFYSLSEIDKLPGIVRTLLAHPDSMKQIIKTGYEKAERYHTWENRARELERLIADIN